MAKKIDHLRSLGSYGAVYKLFRFFGFIDIETERKNYLSALHGKILDIGVGDAGNYKYYDLMARNTSITVLDFSKKMLEAAKHEIKKTLPKLQQKRFKFVHGDAAKLSMFRNNSLDAVVAVYIYCCSVPDSVAALKEARRVLKKNGKLIVFSHVKSKNKAIALFEMLIEPVTRFLIGSDMTRDTTLHLKQAGFKIIEEKVAGWTDIFKVYVGVPKKK